MGKKNLRAKAECAMLNEEKLSNESLEKLSPKEVNLIIHDLKVHQIELEMQNEELKRIQVELDNAKSRYFDIYDLAPEGYLIVSEKGLIIESNITAANMLGVARANIINTRLSLLICPEDQSIYYDHRKDLFQSLAPQECELRMIKNDGTIFWGHIRATVVMNEGLLKCRMILSDVSERKKLVDEILSESNQREMNALKIAQYQVLLKASLESPADMLILSIDKDYNYLFFNEVHRIIMKNAYGKEVAVGMNLLEQITSEDDVIKAKKNYDLAIQGVAHTTIEEYGDLSKRYYETFYNPIKGENNEIIGATAFSRDITSRKLMEQALIESEEKFKTLVMSMDQGLALHEIILEDGKPVDYLFIDINDSYTKLLGVTRDMCIGKRIKEVMPLVEQYWIDEFGKVALTGEPSYYENYLQTTGRYYSTYCYSPSKYRFAVLVSDIDDRIKKEKEINYLNFHDHLTGIYNRRFYEEEIKRLDTERNLPLTIAIGDLNGLKLVNDSFGHNIGDEYLKVTATAIKECCRSDDIIARLGGDEFVIILPKTSSLDTETLIARIQKNVLTKKVNSLNISISFGYETKTITTQKMEDIFKGAEDHMYRHKLYESASMKSRMIGLIMNTLYEKNKREQLHSQRVSEICESLAQNMSLSPEDVAQIKVAGLLHDIGKIGIDEKVLNSKGKLNADEWEELRRHPEVSYRILSSCNEFSELATFVLDHHERWDGTGYPKGIKGEEISLPARIIAIADAYDAMTSERTYKEVLCEQDAIEEIQKCAGTQFDPEIAKVFVQHQTKVIDTNE